MKLPDLYPQFDPFPNLTRERLEALEAENARLRKGIQDYLDGDYGPKVKKMDKCHHGTYGYEICEACTDAHFAMLLLNQQSASSSSPKTKP